MDQFVAVLDVLPAPMREPILFAIPFFLLLLTLEWLAARKLEQVEGREPPAGAHYARDSLTSISMGVVSVATMGAWKALALVAYTAVYAYVAPWQLAANQWYTWVIALVGVDLLYYTYHRIAHRVRLVWATHQAHHSSEYYNLATALRQKWNNSGEILLWLPLPLLGVPPWMVFFSFSISLIYQFWIHTERVGKLRAPIEFLFNTPSHHRVHHGVNPEYLDKNYGGILIIWDRLFGTFQQETVRPRYGLTKPVDTYNIWRLQTHEYVAIARDVARAGRWRDRLGFVFGPPGWRPASADTSALAVAARD